MRVIAIALVENEIAWLRTVLREWQADRVDEELRLGDGPTQIAERLLDELPVDIRVRA